MGRSLTVKIGKSLLPFVTHNLIRSRVERAFFVLSTGRCGTKYLSTLLNLAENATVLHEPPPGCESINPIAYELYQSDKEEFKKVRVAHFEVLERHANLYKSIGTEVFGDCYNSIYPFAIPLYHFFEEMGIDVKFIHLVRHPFACCSSILRAEGPNGIVKERDFRLRAKRLSKSTAPAVISSDIWTNINRLIQYELEYIEGLSLGSCKLIRIEDMNQYEKVIELFEFLALNLPIRTKIEKVIADQTYAVRHSHQKRMDELRVPRVTEWEADIIKERTMSVMHDFGYEMQER